MLLIRCSIGSVIDTAWLRQDFTLLRNSLQQAHPSLYRYTRKEALDSAFDSTYRLLAEPQTELAFYRLLSPLIARVRCGQTQIRLSNHHQQYLLKQAACLPVRVRCVGQKLYVAAIPDSISSQGTGAEILSINGKTTREIIEKIYPNLPIDGYSTTGREQVLGAHFAQLHYTYIEQPAQFVLQVLSRPGQILKVSLPTVPYSRALNGQQVQDEHNQYQRLTPNAALLRVASFSDGQQPFKEWVVQSFTEMNKQGIRNLVLDLRDYQGGRDDYALFLLGYLLNQPFQYHVSLRAATNHFTFLKYTQQGETFNQRMGAIVKKDSAGQFMLQGPHPTLGLHQLNATRFAGKVYVLINGNTFSAAADFAAIAQEHKRGVFTGQETGGAARGNTSNGELILTLPHAAMQVKMGFPQ